MECRISHRFHSFIQFNTHSAVNESVRVFSIERTPSTFCVHTIFNYTHESYFEDYTFFFQAMLFQFCAWLRIESIAVERLFHPFALSLQSSEFAEHETPFNEGKNWLFWHGDLFLFAWQFEALESHLHFFRISYRFPCENKCIFHCVCSFEVMTCKNSCVFSWKWPDVLFTHRFDSNIT